jgi:outer membrane protein assembly factor BamD
MRTARPHRGMSVVPGHPALRAAIIATLMAACVPSFQPKKYHTNPDLFAASMAEYGKKHWDNSITGFERLTLDLTARDTLLPRAHWFLAMSHEQKGEHLLAATSFLRLAETFPDDSLADDALLAAGDSYASLWRDPGLDPTYGTMAQSEYRLLVSIYPDSPLRDRAQKAIALIDDKFATKDYETAMQYVRRRAFDSALIYFKDVVKNFPTSFLVRDALLRMLEVYRNPVMNYQEEAKETCVTLRTAYPGDPDVMKLCPPTAAPADSATKPPAPGKPVKPAR